MKNKLVIRHLMTDIKKRLGNLNLYMKDLNDLNIQLNKMNKNIIKMDTILKKEKIYSINNKS